MNTKTCCTLLTLCALLLTGGTRVYAYTPLDTAKVENFGKNSVQRWQLNTWGADDIAAEVYKSNGYRGKGVTINFTDERPGTYASYQWSEWQPVTGGQTYFYEDYIRCSMHAMQLDVAFTYADGTITYQEAATNIPANGSWWHVQSYVTAPQDAVGMSIYHVADKIGTCTIDQMRIYAVHGTLSLTSDDGYLVTYMETILNKYNMKGTFYLNSGPILGGWDGYVTPADVQRLARDGHEIGSHTVNHEDLTTLSESEIRATLSGDQRALEDMGGTDVESFAYPYGAYNATVQQLVSEYFTSGRGVTPGMNTANTDLLALNATCPTRTTLVRDMKKIVDEVVTTGNWGIVCFHAIVDDPTNDYSWSAAKLDRLLRYLQKRVHVVTVREGARH